MQLVIVKIIWMNWYTAVCYVNTIYYYFVLVLLLISLLLLFKIVKWNKTSVVKFSYPLLKKGDVSRSIRIQKYYVTLVINEYIFFLWFNPLAFNPFLTQAITVTNRISLPPNSDTVSHIFGEMYRLLLVTALCHMWQSRRCSVRSRAISGKHKHTHSHTQVGEHKGCENKYNN